jgi:hypothetical protein
MIERVARAIAFAEGDDYHESASFFENAARAAIQELREPTGTMVAARFNVLGQGGKAEWEAMIDAALAEAP